MNPPLHFKEQLPRCWLWLPTLDGYVLREFLIKFSVIMLLASLLFVTGDVFNDLEDFIGKDSQATTHQMLLYFALKLPGHIRFVLPISVLLGCMWTMATFGKNYEVTAMRAAGLSLFRCGAAILAAGLFVTAINYYLNENFVPQAERHARAIQLAVTKGDGKTAVDQRMLIYTSPDQKRLWLFEVIDDAREFRSVNLKLRKVNDGLVRVTDEIQAGRVSYSPEDGWVFEDVTYRQNAKNDTGIAKPPRHIERMTVTGITETPEDILDSLKDMKELPVWSIWRLLAKTENMPESLQQSFLTVLCYRLTFPLACFLAAVLGIPLATRNERSGILMAVIVAVVIIVAYIAVSETFVIFGRRGVLNAYFAGIAPTFAFIIYGFWRIMSHRV